MDLINDVLELNQIESGRSSVNITAVSSRQVIDQCLMLIQQRAKAHGITLIDATEGTVLPPVQTDGVRAKQILLNLLSNAVKYNRKRGSITLACTSKDDGMVRISITDTGAGIPPSMKGSIFEPFERLGREAGAIEGTEIGLAIAKKLVDLLNGRIGYDSEAGVGSTFWVEFPASDTETVENMDPASLIHESMPTDLKAHDQRAILYIEDNPPNLRLMETIITQYSDYCFLAAHNAELGIDMAHQYNPALILMDINLPGMNGIEASKELRRRSETEGIPVVAVSADALPSQVEEGLHAGFDNYITKPINVLNVVEAIQAAINA